MANHRSRIRFEKLFSGMQPAATKPLSGNGHDCPDEQAQSQVVAPAIEETPFNSPAMLCQEVETLRARVLELETRLQEIETRPFSTPVLYEQEEVGFAYLDHKLMPVRSMQPTVQDESEVIKTPLVASGKAIGEVQIAQPPTRPLTEDDIKLASAIAQQASLQIENLRLLAATERARAEAEEAGRQFTHRNWENFLDAIHNSERIGYIYDQASVEPYLDPLADQCDHEETMQVLDQQIGKLAIKGNGSLTEEDKSLIGAIARQVGQQVENIRLLADASRARAEAEEATRRLTREGWRTYTSLQHENELGFVYDSNQVKSIAASELPEEITLAQPLTVRGETIGQLAVADLEDIPPDAAEFAAAIAERASIQLETLRLSNELQKRAAELQTVAHVGTTVSTVLNPDELLQSVVDLTKERFGLYHAHIYLVDESWHTLLLAAGAGEVGRQMVAEGWNIPLDHPTSLVARAARNLQSVIANDVYRDKNSTYLSNQLLSKTRSEMAVPMISGDKLLGIFDVQADVVDRFTEEDANIYTTLAAQVGVALQNARLYVQQTATVAQLRELDRLKSSFLANMSHELRTPLNSILGFADVMLEGIDGELTEYMDNDLRLIQKNGKHLLHLINDVLDMAKIESGRMNLNPEKFKIHNMLEEVTSITSTLASEKNLSLFIDENSDCDIEVYADNTRMRQVMINLVNNAIKFTEQGKIVISAKAREGGRVLVTVKDTGIGIPPDKLEAIFQEFTQVDSSTTRKVGGTGLGLPISRRLVEMHGGRLWAESTGNPGEGSEFIVELPIEARVAEVVEKQES